MHLTLFMQSQLKETGETLSVFEILSQIAYEAFCVHIVSIVFFRTLKLRICQMTFEFIMTVDKRFFLKRQKCIKKRHSSTWMYWFLCNAQLVATFVIVGRIAIQETIDPGFVGTFRVTPLDPGPEVPPGPSLVARLGRQNSPRRILYVPGLGHVVRVWIIRVMQVQHGTHVVALSPPTTTNICTHVFVHLICFSSDYRDIARRCPLEWSDF